MSNRLKGFYTVMALTILTTLIYNQIGSLNSFDSNHLVTAAETGTETHEERAHEESSLVQNGFSPAGQPPNLTQVHNSSGLARFWKSYCTHYNNRIRRFSMSLLRKVCKTN